MTRLIILRGPWVLAAILAGLMLISALAYKTADPFEYQRIVCWFENRYSLEQIGCQATWLLDNFDRDPQRAIEWFRTYHGEGPGMQKSFTVAQWAIENEHAFVRLVSRPEPEAQNLLLRWLPFGLLKNGDTEMFARMFKPYAEHDQRFGAFYDAIVR